MDWQTLATQLFPGGHDIVERDNFLSGSAQVAGQAVDVIGTTGHVPIGIEIALAEGLAEPMDIWSRLGIAEPASVPMLDADAFLALASRHRVEAGKGE